MGKRTKVSCVICNKRILRKNGKPVSHNGMKRYACPHHPGVAEEKGWSND